MIYILCFSYLFAFVVLVWRYECVQNENKMLKKIIEDMQKEEEKDGSDT